MTRARSSWISLGSVDGPRCFGLQVGIKRDCLCNSCLVYIDVYRPTCQDRFIAVVNRQHKKTRENENKQRYAWHTEKTMATELKWSKPRPKKIELPNDYLHIRLNRPLNPWKRGLFAYTGPTSSLP